MCSTRKPNTKLRPGQYASAKSARLYAIKRTLMRIASRPRSAIPDKKLITPNIPAKFTPLSSYRFGMKDVVSEGSGDRPEHFRALGQRMRSMPERFGFSAQ